MASGTDETRTLTPALLGLVWSAMFGFSGFFLSYSTMVSIGVADGLSTVTGGAVLTTMMVGVIAVQPFAPRLGERLGLRAALLIALGLQLLGQVLGLVVGPPLLSLVLAGISGGMGFGPIPAVLACLSEAKIDAGSNTIEGCSVRMMPGWCGHRALGRHVLAQRSHLHPEFTARSAHIRTVIRKYHCRAGTRLRATRLCPAAAVAAKERRGRDGGCRRA